MSSKFGAKEDEILDLLTTAQNLKINLIGISFHVGSACEQEDAFEIALKKTRQTWTLMQQKGFNPHLIDIGGGFPGEIEKNNLFLKMAESIRNNLEKLFSLEVGLKVIAEPGRFFCTSIQHLCVQIIGKRKRNQGLTNMYVVNDGIYGSLNCIM